MISLNKIMSVLLICISVVSANQSPANNEKPANNTAEPQAKTADWQPYPIDKFVRRVNRVHKAGLLWLNMTNMGGFGKMGSDAGSAPAPWVDHATGKFPLGAELPGGSSMEYLYGAGLYIGGYLDSTNTNGDVVKNANDVQYFQGPLVSTGYEGWSAKTVAGGKSGPCKEFMPTGFAPWTPGVPANKVRFTETSNILGRENVFGQDVYDASASAHEQLTCWFTDWNDDAVSTNYCENDEKLRPQRESGSNRYHLPLGVEVKQTSYAWSSPFAQKFILIDYTIYNTNPSKSIYNMFIGMMFDCDVLSSKASDQQADAKDDLGGFKQNAKIVDEATGEFKDVPINMCWVADNDGRDGTPSGALNGATSIASVRVLRNPNPAIRYSFNMYNADGNGGGFAPTDEPLDDWGPRWKDGYHDLKEIYDPQLGVAVSNPGYYAQYDLTRFQRGYSDGGINDGWNIRKGKGGMTEGWPLGDAGRYMVMANGEFDYDFTMLQKEEMANGVPSFDLSTVLPELNTGILKPEYKQAHKWQPFLPADGDRDKMLDHGNGADAKFLLSFGPLGVNSKNIKVATGTNSQVDKQDIWKIAARDSVKLTIAFVVSENFHYDPTQSGTLPQLTDEKVNWVDAFRNANWADRLYDVPLFDTKVRLENGEEKGDGWFGEDIGKDGVFAEVKGYKCWWNNTTYTDSDEGEGNGEIDTFTVAQFDGSISEDVFMKWANETPGAGAWPDSIGPSSVFGYTDHKDHENPSKFIRAGYGDILITRGDGVPDFSAPEAPPSPDIKVETEGTNIIITWTSDNFGKPGTSPEIIPDKFSRIADFEGYKVCTSESENVKDFVQIFSVDRLNYVYESLTIPGKYLDIPFDDDPNNPAPSILPPDSSVTVLWKYDQNGQPDSIVQKNNTKSAFVKKAFDQNNYYRQPKEIPGLLSYIPTMKPNGVWEYKVILRNRIIGKSQYVSVVSTDFGFPKSDTDPLMSSPSMNKKRVVAAKIANSNKVTVIPNPYRADVNYEKIKWESTTDKWRETDRKIVFANVPNKSIIRIYTLAGDLVKTISHNGMSRESQKHGDYSASWNLLNENDQSVASGVYLFAVDDIEGKVDKFVGKFVIIK